MSPSKVCPFPLQLIVAAASRPCHACHHPVPPAQLTCSSTAEAVTSYAQSETMSTFNGQIAEFPNIRGSYHTCRYPPQRLGRDDCPDTRGLVSASVTSLLTSTGKSLPVDHFRILPGSTPPLACFLSHVHSDHLAGLESLRSPL